MVRTEQNQTGTGPKWPARIAFGLLIAALAVSFIVRIRLLDAPLERDEGEHAYMAQTMLAGHPPWQLAYHHKLPGTDAVYALFLALAGQTAAPIRVALLIVNTLTVLLVAMLGRKLFGAVAGAVSGASYAILSSGQGALGTIFHSTHLVALFAVFATLLLLRDRTDLVSLFCTGLAYGFTFLMKQPGAVFGVGAGLFLIWRIRQRRVPWAQAARELMVYSLGCILPFALLCLGLWRAGVFAEFWYWTVTLAQAYAAQRPLAQSLALLGQTAPALILPDLLLWLLAGAGMVLVFLNRELRRSAVVVAGFLVCGFIAVSLGRLFSSHYFIMMFPAVALCVGAFEASAELLAGRWWNPARTKVQSRKSGRKKSRVEEPREPASATGWIQGLPVICCVLACLYSVVQQSAYFFRMTSFEFERSSYGTNPFPEAEQVGEYIRSHSKPDATVAVLGSESEIYFYARRRAATGYLFMYPLMEDFREAEGLQRDLIRKIEAARPEYVVYVSDPFSWLVLPKSRPTLLNWMPAYLASHYEPVGLIDTPDLGPAKYIWGKDAASYRPRGIEYMVVTRRKDISHPAGGGALD